MSQDFGRIRDLSAKLIRLANDPAASAGEKAVAQLKLTSILTRHGLTVSDLDSPDKSCRAVFHCSSKDERTLILQCAFWITDSRSLNVL